MEQWLNRCHFGDVRTVLRQMAADGVQVHTIVTSPPYWGLRSYLPADHPDKAHEIGSEPTIGRFITTMVEVFDLCRQVLRDDGTMWVNMGDSYAGSWGAQSREHAGKHAPNPSAISANQIKAAQIRESGTGSMARTPGLKPKDLIGQPWRLALALQDGTCACSTCGQELPTSAWHVHNGHRVCVPCLIDGKRDSKVLSAMPGWWLRQDIIWNKPNPMPESIRDRCTKAHEYIFLLSKSEKYFYDFDAMQEPVNGGAHARRPMEYSGMKRPGFGHGYDEAPKPRYKTPDGWATHPGAHGSFHKEGREKGREADDPQPGVGRRGRKLADEGSGTKNNGSMDDALADVRSTRNRRSVWTIASEPYSGAHFATFPRALVEPCILAGCPPGGTVLDIFFGSGTTGQVAQALGRNFIGIDINRANEPLQAERLRQPSLLLEAA